MRFTLLVSMEFNSNMMEVEPNGIRRGSDKKRFVYAVRHRRRYASPSKDSRSVPSWFLAVVRELGLPRHAAQDAFELCRLYCNSRGVRSRPHWLLAALLLLSKSLGGPVPAAFLEELARKAGININARKLALISAEMSSSLRLSLKTKSPNYIPFIIAGLRKDQETSAKLKRDYGELLETALLRLEVKAIDMSRRLETRYRGLLAGKSPLVTAAASVWLTAKSLGMRAITQEAVAKAAGISHSALRRRIYSFGLRSSTQGKGEFRWTGLIQSS